MALAQVGPLTTLFETAATAVGAGVVLGSVSMGVVGLALGWSRSDIEGRALSDGYIGGAIGAGVALLDILLRYGV